MDTTFSNRQYWQSGNDVGWRGTSLLLDKKGRLREEVLRQKLVCVTVLVKIDSAKSTNRQQNASAIARWRVSYKCYLRYLSAESRLGLCGKQRISLALVDVLHQRVITGTVYDITRQTTVSHPTIPNSIFWLPTSLWALTSHAWPLLSAATLLISRSIDLYT